MKGYMIQNTITNEFVTDARHSYSMVARAPCPQGGDSLAAHS